MAASVIYCGNCGTQNTSSESFCSACGYSLAASSAEATALPASTPTGQLPSQTLLRGRYRVLRSVGKGGMGAVYLAQDTQLGNRFVAVKEMRQSGLSDQQAQNARENFKREAHLLASLQHPNLPSIHDYFEENGHWYLVMSFIQGETLEDYLDHAPQQRLSLEETLVIAQELCTVLDYLHSHLPPIIFRDLKPSNVIRSADGHLYLIDFGIARHFKPGQTRDTASYGSMGYSPPEQFGHAQTTERSDIYSLGATLYECLSGFAPSSAPFHLPPLDTLVSTLPERLVRLITRMLELDPTARPANIKAVQQELQKVAGDKFDTVAIPPPPPTTSSSTIQYTPPPVQYPVTPQTPVQFQQQAFNIIATPVPPRPARSVLAIPGMILSIIGIIIGSGFMLFALFGAFFGGEGLFTDLSVADIVFFFGLMLLFIALIRRTRFPISRARRAKARLGMLACIIAIVLGIVLIILRSTPGTNDYFGIGSGIISIIEGLIIWLTTSVRRQRTP